MDLVYQKKRRAYIKGSMTKVLKYIDTIGTVTNVENIKVRLANVERYRTEFFEIENKIITLDPTEELDEEFEENYYKAVAGLNHALRSKMEPPINLNDTVHETSISGGHMDVKLPRIGIPSFSGDYTEWQSFYDLFCSTIHDNPRLTPSQKLQYLKGTLQGEASGLLKHFSITDANYIEAIKKLKDRYDRKKHIIYTFIKNFMSQPNVTTPTSAYVRRLLDTSDEVIRGLKALGEEAESRDHWLIHIMVSKLDEETNNLWAQESAKFNLPSLKQFFEFLTRRIDALESLKGANKQANTQHNVLKHNIKSHVTYSNPNLCSLCPEEQHKLFECVKFNKMLVDERRAFLKGEGRCFNCLNNNHNVYACKSRYRCRQCNKKHHSLVHENSTVNAEAKLDSHQNQSGESSSSSTCASTTYIGGSILPTALIHVTDRNNQQQLCRALLDSGSQGSFISERCAQKLQLKRSNAKVAISGIGASTNGYTKGLVSLLVKPWNKAQPCLHIEAFVFPKLTTRQTSITQFIDLNYFKKFELADPHFHEGAEIDIIIGADTFFELLSDGKVITTNNLILQNTLLGWVIAGKSTKLEPQQSTSVTISNQDNNLEKLLKKFWEIESIEVHSPNLSQEEELCVQHFDEHKTRDKTGRFIVRLPFKVSPSDLGDSFRLARQRMHSMEKRFMNDEKFALQYKHFMLEYLQLGHMKEMPENEINLNGYYLPHHGVIKSSSSTTKLRVVFDGSAKTNTGKSLNDCLAVGPVIQSSLYEILLRFRMFKIAFTADIEKMYRQVGVAADETKYQRIIWRDSPSKPFTTYQLQTVTYGTASATYLATRALVEAAERHKHTYPEAVNQIKTNMYVDDLMTGADSTQDAIRMINEINYITSDSGFHLRKWLTNNETVLTNLNKDTSEANILEIEESNSVKVLGLHWNPRKDCFQFKVNLNEKPIINKRGILSEASRVFDPLGWLAPVTIVIKIFFQTLWTQNLTWDEQLPDSLAGEWLKLRANLPQIEHIELDRYINTNINSKIVLHGFSDASKHAYAAVVYGQIINSNEQSVIKLLSAKTKVAPVKQISIPRLELCGALLLCKLLENVKKALKIEISEVVAWTDSTIVLDWLSAHPTKWNTFVGNRTGEILSTMNRTQWRHVDSHDNPSDCASRGIEPDKLRGLSLWWNGPIWLANPEHWPKNKGNELPTAEEMRTQSMNVQTQSPNIIDELIDNISSFSTMVRVLAYVIQFVKFKLKQIKTISPYLTGADLQEPRNRIFRHIQSKYFELEIKHISTNKALAKSSKLKYFKPILDESGLLRVGGRISNASFSYDIKHPLILPAKEKLTEAIVREHHIRHLHAGPTLMMATLRQRYWILGGRNLIKKIIQNCVKCVKYSGKESNQVMGNLPKSRIELIKPFYKVGVDYAGPFHTHLTRGRGQKTYKSYVCIFICLATKAVHIELVSDLTTDAYIAALRRFVARRGICTEIQSDNGSNFVGARNHLYELFKFIRQNSNVFSKFLLTDQITFNFIPPGSPHFGGLWEAAVKSMKHHLKRVTDGHILTIEEFSTLLAEVEAILNSRPICVLSNDDTDYLTPAHFLIGRPTTQVPNEDLTEIKLSRLSRWQMIQQFTQHIWKRWNLEYITNLQNRSKWHEIKTNIKIDDIVLIKDTNLPPAKWLMGRVIELYPGADNITRVVNIKTVNGIIKRPIHKLCILPVG